MAKDNELYERARRRWTRGENFDHKRAWRDIERLQRQANRMEYQMWRVNDERELASIWRVISELWADQERRGFVDPQELVTAASGFFAHRRSIRPCGDDEVPATSIRDALVNAVEVRAFCGTSDIFPGELRDWMTYREAEDDGGLDHTFAARPAWHIVERDKRFVFIRTKRDEQVSWRDCCFEMTLPRRKRIAQPSKELPKVPGFRADTRQGAAVAKRPS